MPRPRSSSCRRSASGSSFRNYAVSVTSDSFTFCRRFRAILASLPRWRDDPSQRPWRTSHAKRHRNFCGGKIPGGKESGAAFDRLKPFLRTGKGRAEQFFDRYQLVVCPVTLISQHDPGRWCAPRTDWRYTRRDGDSSENSLVVVSCVLPGGRRGDRVFGFRPDSGCRARVAVAL